MKDEDGEPALPDEEVPARTRGRPVRPMPADALDVPRGARKDAAKCRECPRWDDKRDWCPLRAAICSGHMPACMYGTVLIRAKRLADRRKRK